MSLPISPEYLHYIVDAGILVGIWKGIRTLNRLYDVMLDFPPHAHDNGTIRYPKGFEPGMVVKHEQRGRA